MKNGVAEQNITWEACKCDRLDKEEFRRRYIRHRCEYHKTTGTALSEYERKEKEIRDQNTIGNFIILPMELAHCRETYKNPHGEIPLQTGEMSLRQWTPVQLMHSGHQDSRTCHDDHEEMS